MQQSRLVILLAVAGILALAIATSGSAAPVVEAGGDSRAMTGKMDVVSPGTAWVVQRPGKVVQRYNSWGLKVRHKTGGYVGEWFFMPLTLPTVVDGTPMRISLVEFCAKTTNPQGVRPTLLRLNEDASMFEYSAILWPNKKTKHCHSVGFNPPVWKQTLGLSVRVQFWNNTDSITFFKAWVRVVP